MTWLAFDQDTTSNLITVLGILVAALMVVWQLGRQHRDSLMRQRDNAREELKVRLHELLVQKVRDLTEAIVSAKMYAFLIPAHLEGLEHQRKLGIQPRPSEKRADEFAKLHHEAAEATTNLFYDFEAWSMAFPGLEVFKVALNSVAHDAREAFSPLHTALLEALPMDPPPDAPAYVPRPITPPPLSKEKTEQLKALVNNYSNAMDDIGVYVGDLMIESQNNLLSGLFERRVPLREPIDPRHRVISTDPEKVSDLLAYFNNETPWGREKKEIEDSVRSSLDKNR